MEKAPNRRIGAFLHFDISWRGGHDFGLRAAAARVALAAADT